jgi:hypothetical protein
MRKTVFALLSGLMIATGLFAQKTEGEFISLREKYTIGDDGSVVYKYHKELKVNTFYSIHNLYGETFIVYNPDYQTLTIDGCHTVQADKTMVPLPPNALNEVLPSAAADAPAYNHLKEMVVTHTGLEPGAVISLDYTITTKPGFPGSGDIFRSFNEVSPVRDYTLVIEVPAGKELVVSQSLGAKMTKSADGREYTFKASGIPARLNEIYAPVDDVPYIYASVNPGEGAAAVFNLPKEDMSTLASKICEGKTGDTEKMDAISMWVAQNLGFCALPLNQAGKVRKPSEVVASAYGTFEEKAALMLSLASAVGVKAEPVALFAPTCPPCLQTLSGAMWIKASDKYYSAAGGFSRPVADLKGRFQALSPSGTVSVPEAFTEVKIDETVSLDPKNATEAGDYLVFNLPVARESLDASGVRSLNSSRSYPIELPFKLDESVTYRIEAPEGGTIVSEPFEKTLSCPAGSVKVKLTVSGGTAVYTREAKILKTIVPVKEYASLRNMFNLYKDDAYRTIVVKK